MAPIRATYRLQLRGGLTLARVRGLVPYLARLGVSHLHCAPMLRARRGSGHGYDVVDPTALDPELGTEADLAALHAELRAHGMGIVLDIVPNHMAASPENAAWEDVLTHGPASRFAAWFDIDWRATERELRSRVLLPVLGAAMRRVLEQGELGLALEAGVPRVRYHEHDFPLDPHTIAPLLAAALPGVEREFGAGHAIPAAMTEIVRALAGLPRRRATDPRALARRREASAAALDRLRALAAAEPRLERRLADGLARYTGGEDGRARLRRLLDLQVYRLVHWRRAAREINYRRFFEVNDLVALHMESPEVFAQTHARVLDWRRRGWLDGFRVDHPDGLLDPRAYLERLAGTAFPDVVGRPPIYVEKILSHGERLREDWPVAGTTGYDFLNEVEAVFQSPEGYTAIEEEYRRVIRQPLDFASIARLGKRAVLEEGLSASVRRLAERLARLAGPEQPRRVPIHALGRALVETIVSLPVYRTYVDERVPVPEGEDRSLLEGALADARARGRARPESLDLLESALLAREGPLRAPGREQLRLRFVQRFQQLCGPATAKGVEDTAFFAYTPLLSRNEVGGGPEAPLPLAMARFHAGNAHRAQRFPAALLAATTHDTKRSADVRARLDVLTEIPAEWAARLHHWRALNQPFKTAVRGRRLPDPNTVQHVLQAMVGVWPVTPLAPGALETLRERLTEYALKAAREAKQRTSWTDPDPEFEEALRADVEALLAPDRAPRFLDDLDRFVRRIGRAGLWNALGRTVLQLAAPGVPDIYQGDELWSFLLVDPDNRRPVDFDARARLLAEVEAGFDGTREARLAFLADLVRRPEDGRIKLHVIRTALLARRRAPAAFESTAYRPLEARGPAARRVVAFERGEASRLVAAVPRLVARRVLEGMSPVDPALWADSALPLPPGSAARWTCALSGETVEAVDGSLPLPVLFRHLPAALLLGASSS